MYIKESTLAGAQSVLPGKPLQIIIQNQHLIPNMEETL